MTQPPDAPTPRPPVPCPDCGAPNPPAAEQCAECHHPLAPAGAESIGRAPRRPPREERERAPATVATWGYRPPGPGGRGGGGASAPTWLWAAIGLFALGVVLVTAIQIANAPVPLAVPNASPAQLASAESLAVLVRADSSAAGPNTALGNLFYDTGNYGLAAPYYRRALAADPSLIDVQVDLAVSYHNDGQSERAREVLEDAVRKRPDHAVAHFDLGIVYHQLGRREEARRSLARARSLAGPEEMMRVIDQLLLRMADSTLSAEGLPPGHPPSGVSSPP